MTVKIVAYAFAISALASTSAFAQSAAPAQPAAPVAGTASSVAPSFLTQAAAGEYRGSQLVGVNIYNASNESIGEVNELLVDKSGSIKAVVIGVGGFLGIGQKNVALPYTAITWEDKPLANAAVGMASPPAGGMAPATGTATDTGAMTAAAPAPSADTSVKDYPDHGLLNMTKEQLQAAPEFKFASEAK